MVGASSDCVGAMRKVGAIWGVFGVMLLLGFAIYRLTPFALELFQYQLNIWQVLAMIIWCVIMVYSEGYKAFGRQFAPRVVARAQYVSRQGNWLQVLLAPVFCIGYFGAPVKRIIISIALIVGIIALILLVHFVPQPWRGIIDVGVIFGLACGIFYLGYYAYKAMRQQDYVIDPDVVPAK